MPSYRGGPERPSPRTFAMPSERGEAPSYRGRGGMPSRPGEEDRPSALSDARTRGAASSSRGLRMPSRPGEEDRPTALSDARTRGAASSSRGLRGGPATAGQDQQPGALSDARSRGAAPSSRGLRGGDPARSGERGTPTLGASDETRSRGPRDITKLPDGEQGRIFRRGPAGAAGESGAVPYGDSGVAPGSRGLLDRDARGIPYADSGQEFLPPPPPPPIGGHRGDWDDHRWNDYYDDAHHHYNRYGHNWFGGHHSWQRFIGASIGAPWFWPSYSYVYQYPWVFGYYEPEVYASFGFHTPYWGGRVYSPWRSWCDAPFVYWYYRYPARFSFNVGIGGDYGYADAGYYDGGYDDTGDYDDGYYEDSGYYEDAAYYGEDLYDGGATLVAGVYDRPLGVWVPGHWEQQVVTDTEWAWVPGHYIY